MKRLFSVLFIAVLLSAMNSSVFSQVTTVPAGTGPYASLNAAFAAINAGGVYTGAAVTVTITADLVEVAQANLNGGVFASCLIVPSGNRTVTLNANASVINLNGADVVTIDGLNSGGNSLTIVNPNAGTGANGVQCSNGASNNTIRNITCVGAGANGGTAGGRGVNIGQSIAGTSGNNDNTIENCTTNGFRRGIQNFGTDGNGTFGFYNERTIIRGCTIKNATSLYIFIGTVTKDNVVENNSIFSDAPVLNDAAGSRGINIQGQGTNTVQNNKIYSLTGTVAGGFIGIITIPARVLAPLSNMTTKVELYNNMVALDNSLAAAPFIYGIFPASNTNTVNYTMNCYYNSIMIAGSSGVTAGVLTLGLVEGQDGSFGPDTARFYNNIANNYRTGGDAASLHVSINLDPNLSASVSTEADYNMAYTNDTTASHWDYWLGSQLYRGIGGMYLMHDSLCAANLEQNTVFWPAPFVSFTDLHLDTSFVGTNFDAKSNLAKPVATDIDGQSRAITGTNYFTYRGCDEVLGGKRSWTINFKLEEVVPYPFIIGIWLRNSAPPYALTDAAWIRVNSWVGATASVKLNSGPYIADGGSSKYIEMTTDHSIRTQSANPLDFSTATSTYDFTTSPSQAYGGNMAGSSAPYEFYNGDVNQDDIIDGTDGALVDNDAFNFVGGCSISTDVNDDEIVDGSDAAIADNNAFNFIGAVLLPGTQPSPLPGKNTDSQTQFSKTLEKANVVKANIVAGN